MLARFQAVVQGGSHRAEGEKWSHFAGVLDVGGREDKSEGSGAEQLEGWNYHSHLLPLAAVTRPHRMTVLVSPPASAGSPISFLLVGFCLWVSAASPGLCLRLHMVFSLYACVQMSLFLKGHQLCWIKGPSTPV